MNHGVFSPCNLLRVLVTRYFLKIRSAFWLCSPRFHILLQNFYVTLSSGYLNVFVQSPLTYWWNLFRYFWMFCFVCIVFIKSQNLFSLLTLVLSDFFPRVVSFVLLVLLFPFHSNEFKNSLLLLLLIRMAIWNHRSPYKQSVRLITWDYYCCWTTTISYLKVYSWRPLSRVTQRLPFQ